MFELFGPDMPLAAKFFIAFAVVLALIGLTAWLVRRFGSNRLGAGARGRQPRLAVIDAATVDGRRRLVLIRRDNVEHLLMIGGPTDVVIEPNIVRATGAREMAREPARPEPAMRAAPATESSWPLQPSSEPTPIPAPRPYRSSATEEPWLAPEPGARPRPADSLTGLAAELSTRLNPLEPPTAPIARSEPAPRPSAAPVMPPPAPPEPATPAQTDHNLAEMAQQLEAALRRTPMPDSRPPVTDPLAASLTKPAPARDFKPRVEPKFEPKIETRLEPAATSKTNFDNLEEEMASLLGRPPGKT
ncbi:MAG TPA: flagellar biosynthetic protein FliO [Pseudolabrys sp.]|nr:flagellar biosynthetic protein FliO [Pseudolabrys sp.]